MIGSSRSQAWARLQGAVEADRAEYAFPAVVLRVECPRAGLAGTFAAGFRDLRVRTPITGDETFRIASITKPFTAACILKLAERGTIELERSIESLLPAEFVEVLRAQGYAPETIAVRHLLQHTAGLRESPTVLAAFSEDPGRRWTPLEHFRVSVDGTSPLTAPGEAFLYSDAGYTLLGRIVEGATGRPQAEAYRALLNYDALGLAHTWFEYLEDPPPGAPPRAHQYLGNQDAGIYDASIDLYGGGGLLSTVEDLIRFFRALLAGKVFDAPATLETMLREPGIPAPRQYGHGIQRLTVAGVDMWGHRGYWGSECFHAPDLDLTWAVTRNTADTPTDYDPARLIAPLLDLPAGRP